MTEDQQTSLIVSRREGAVVHVTLNRPRAINALNIEMFTELHRVLGQPGDSTAFYLDGAGERGFCGGGDIKEIVNQEDPRVLFRLEYTLDYAVHVSEVPVVAIMDGITMGGGIGLGAHAAYRVVTERSRLAMPESRIGLAPDVGGHYLLARAPGRLGEYLALTAAEMTAGDAFALGFADYFVPSDKLEALKSSLIAGETPDAALAALAETAPDAPTLAVRDWFGEIANSVLSDERTVTDPVGALTDLVHALEASNLGEARETAAVIREMCPLSLAVTLAQIARTRAENLSLAEVLEDDFRIVPRVATHPNFREGVRAQVIDKDRNPTWQPARIEDLSSSEIAALLAPHGAGEAALGLLVN